MVRRFGRLLPVCLWMIVIGVMSHQQDSGNHSSGVLHFALALLGLSLNPESIAQVHWLLRKCAHVSEYAILAFLIGRASVAPPPRLFAQAFIVSVLFAASDEWHQNFVPQRVGSLQDVLIDSLGASLGLVALAIWRHVRQPTC